MSIAPMETQPKQSFMQIYFVHRAFVQLALQHPSSVTVIDASWREYLTEAGWTAVEWASEMTRSQQRIAMEAQGLSEAEIANSMDKPS